MAAVGAEDPVLPDVVEERPQHLPESIGADDRVKQIVFEHLQEAIQNIRQRVATPGQQRASIDREREQQIRALKQALVPAIEEMVRGMIGQIQGEDAPMAEAPKDVPGEGGDGGGPPPAQEAEADPVATANKAAADVMEAAKQEGINVMAKAREAAETVIQDARAEAMRMKVEMSQPGEGFTPQTFSTPTTEGEPQAEETQELDPEVQRIVDDELAQRSDEDDELTNMATHVSNLAQKAVSDPDSFPLGLHAQAIATILESQEDVIQKTEGGAEMGQKASVLADFAKSLELSKSRDPEPGEEEALAVMRRELSEFAKAIRPKVTKRRRTAAAESESAVGSF